MTLGQLLHKFGAVVPYEIRYKKDYDVYLVTDDCTYDLISIEINDTHKWIALKDDDQ